MLCGNKTGKSALLRYHMVSSVFALPVWQAAQKYSDSAYLPAVVDGSYRIWFLSMALL